VPRRLGAALAALLATVALLFAAWCRADRQSVTLQLLPPGDPAARLQREIDADFGLQNPVVWVIVARGSTVWSAPVLDHLQNLTREVFRIPGVIAPEVMSIASPNLRTLRVTEDSMQPVYLMPSVPRGDVAIQELRHRVEGDANYSAFVSGDGVALMVVADFRRAADAAAIGSKALALRDRYRDAKTEVYVSGAPVLAATAPAGAAPIAIASAAIVLAGMLVFAWLGGAAALWRLSLAAVLALSWTALALVALRAVQLPWSLGAPVIAALLAMALATSDDGAVRRRVVAVALALGFLGLAIASGAPAGVFAIGAAIGTLAALAAAELARVLVRRCDAGQQRATRRGLVLTALAVAGAVAPGVALLHLDLGLFGYGVRYAPAAAAADLRAIGEYFPPPSALAVRLRGDPGFVKSPAVMRTLEALTDAVRGDPAVVRALSLADLVKLVNRAFHEDRSEYQVLPDDPNMIGRYLTLGYSPGFRRFVDRGFSQTAVWVYVDGDRIADLERVRDRLATEIAAHPLPGVRVDSFGGDGAVVLGTARIVQRIMLGGALLLLVAALLAGLADGFATGFALLAGGLLAAAVTAGGFGWLELPVDLLTLPCLLIATVAGAALAALRGVRPLAAALGVAGGVAATVALLSASALPTVVAVTLLAVSTAAAAAHG
jgi:hypothetical protein